VYIKTDVAKEVVSFLFTDSIIFWGKKGRVITMIHPAARRRRKNRRIMTSMESVG
jgi:hypothetical protein